MRKLLISFFLLLTVSCPSLVMGETVVWYNPQGGEMYHKIGICDAIHEQYWHNMQSISIQQAKEKKLSLCERCFSEDYLYDQFIKDVEQTKNISLDEEKILFYASAYINALSQMDAYTQTHPDYNYQFEAEFFTSRTDEELSGFDWRCALAPKEALQWRQVLLLGYAYLDQICRVSVDQLKYYFSDPMYQILPSGEPRWRIGMPMALHYLDVIRLPEVYDLYIDPKDAHLLSMKKN